MKKLVLVLAILILVSGCVETMKDISESVVDTTANVAGEVIDTTADIAGEVIDTAEDVAGGVIGIAGDVAEGVGDVAGEVAEGVSVVVEEVLPDEDVAEELGDDKYKIKVKTAYTIKGVDITITDIDMSTSQIRADIGGDRILFDGTKETEIISDLEIFVDTFENHGLSDSRTFVIMNIKDLVLGEDEYLIRRGILLTLPDVNKTKVSLSSTRRDDTGVRTATIGIGGDSENIVEGKSPTRFDKFFVTNVRTFTQDKKYAILKIVGR